MMMKKAMFIVEAMMKGQTMTVEAWKAWAYKAAQEAGYTLEEVTKILENETDQKEA